MVVLAPIMVSGFYTTEYAHLVLVMPHLELSQFFDDTDVLVHLASLVDVAPAILSVVGPIMDFVGCPHF